MGEVEDFWAEYHLDQAKDTEFDVAQDDFNDLEIRGGGTQEEFHYFFDNRRSRLIKSFLLKDSSRTDKVCDVVLIKKTDEGYSPRLRFWIRDKSRVATGARGAQATAEVTAQRMVKASVDVGDCHETLWRLIDFLRSFKNIDLPADEFRVAGADQAQLLEALKSHDVEEILSTVGSYLDGKVTGREVQMLVNRRTALETFEKLLTDPDFVEEEKKRLSKSGLEALWQQFFEDNPWIFGYGLKLISCEGYSSEKLEQITTGVTRDHPERGEDGLSGPILTAQDSVDLQIR